RRQCYKSKAYSGGSGRGLESGTAPVQVDPAFCQGDEPAWVTTLDRAYKSPGIDCIALGQLLCRDGRAMLCAPLHTPVAAVMDKWKSALDLARSGESKYKIL
ncbi:hypothetical protein LUU93_21585, partial [Flavobacterium sp. SCIV07]